jgi:hypothetical protein
MAQNTIQKPLPGTETWFAIFGVGYSLLAFVLPAFSKLMLLIFFFNLQWFDNPISKLIFSLFLVYSVMGFWIFFIKIHEYWEEAFIPFQRSKYFQKIPNTPISLKIIIPEKFGYDPNKFVGFFFFMGNAFKTTNASKQAQYNYGRWFSNFCFDFVVHDGAIDLYATFPRKKFNEVVELFKRFFPEFKLENSEDPFKSWPKTFNEKDKVLGYDRVVGFNLGNSKSNMYPYNETVGPTYMPFDFLLRAIRDTIPEAIVVVQTIFRFNPSNWGGNPEGEYYMEFKAFREDLLKQYAPINNGHYDTHALEAFLPHWAHKAISTTGNHLNMMYPSSTYRLMALTDDANDELVYQKLEKFCRIFQGNSFGDFGNDIELKYPTSTHQEYKNDKTSGNPKYQMIYDTFVFPDWFGDQFEALMTPFYEQYYYPNENRYRRRNIYKTTVKRDLNAPWNGDWNLNEAHGFAILFQFPALSSDPMPIENLIGDVNIDQYKKVFQEGRQQVSKSLAK